MDSIQIDTIGMFDACHSTEVIYDTDAASFEGLLEKADVTFGDYNDIMRFRENLRKQMLGSIASPLLTSDAAQGSGEGWVVSEFVPEEPKIVEKVQADESTIIISFETIIRFFIYDADYINAFIRQVDAIPEKNRLNIIVEACGTDLSYITVEAGPAIINIIRKSKCHKVFNLGSEIGLTELFIAMCCDDVYVSEFASVSITTADNGRRISRYLVPIYRNQVMKIYKYWAKKGLFTAEDIEGLFESEADNSIQLLSGEIKTRLGL
jgi:hypothetical protein